MVVVTYSVNRREFTVSFQRANCDWGDYLAGAYRSLAGITAGLKAGGLEFSTAVSDETRLRLEYDPRTKAVAIHLARHGDAWQENVNQVKPVDESTDEKTLDPV
jgi:hypothetical protein